MTSIIPDSRQQSTLTLSGIATPDGRVDGSAVDQAPTSSASQTDTPESVHWLPGVSTNAVRDGPSVRIARRHVHLDGAELVGAH